jgi:uncharacterized protein (TIGR02391 family)
VAKTFTPSQIEALAKALADTHDGLTGSEIGQLLATYQIADPTPGGSKWVRLHNAFAARQNADGNRTAILAFIRGAMRPERYARKPEHFEPLRANLNKALSFAGLMVDETGVIGIVDPARTLPEAARRAEELRTDLIRRGVHPDVLEFCRAELLVDNYFHAVLEAVKSVSHKLRTRTGLQDDGNILVDRALGGDPPMLAVNALRTESERNEQRGFANLLRGTHGMFRNVIAHEAKVLWIIRPMPRICCRSSRSSIVASTRRTCRHASRDL